MEQESGMQENLRTRPETFIEYLSTISDGEEQRRLKKRHNWLLSQMGILDGKHRVPTLAELGTSLKELTQLYLWDPQKKI